jgi:Arc/MetJ family transcription regulator
MGRTNIVLDDRLVQLGLELTGLKTRRQLIDYALKELLRHENQKKILELRGTITWEGNLDSWREGREF